MTRQCIQRTVKVLAVLFWVFLILLCGIYRDSITVDGIVNYVPGNTLATIGIMLALFALKGITVVVYGGILCAASGILFSLPVAICVNLAGTVLMASVPFFIGKKAGTGLIDQLARKNKRLELLRDAYGDVPVHPYFLRDGYECPRHFLSGVPNICNLRDPFGAAIFGWVHSMAKEKT